MKGNTTSESNNVAASGEESRPRHYWALQFNPDWTPLESQIADKSFIDSWTAGGSDLQKGDRAIIWKAQGHKLPKRRGIIALAEVLTNPVLREDIDNTERVDVRYVVPPHPLWLGEAHDGVLSDLTVSRATGGTVFIVTPDQWEKVMSVVGGWPEDNGTASGDYKEFENLLDVVTGRCAAGPGFQNDINKRRAVELHAMDRARKHYRKDWASVEDVSAKQPYDLLCTAKHTSDELRVEVKGTQGGGDKVILTRNEVLNARTNRTALFIVANIRVTETDSGFKGSGGDIVVIDSWKPADSDLEPLQYSYKV